MRAGPPLQSSLIVIFSGWALGLGCLLDTSPYDTSGGTTSNGGSGGTTTPTPTTSNSTSSSTGGSGGTMTTSSSSTTTTSSQGGGGTGGEGGAGGMMTGGGGTGGTMTTTSTPTDPTSCWDALQQGMTDSGVVTIDPNGDGTKIEVYCDQVNDEGGWALLYNSLGVENGTTPAFWNIPYEARLATKIEPPGPPGLDKNYYAGSLYIHGKEYRDDIVDLGGSEVRNVMRATADGIETATMKFISPKVVTGINLNSAIYNDQFAKGWSAPGDPDFDGDEAGYNCAVFWGNITQHYASCWKYNLGADGNVADKSDDNWGPHVFNSVIDQINLASPNGASLAKQPNDNDASRVNRISRFVRWGKNP